MMIKRILILLTFCLTLFGNAQNNPEINNVEDLVSNYIKQLQSRKIDTICVYENYCVGSVKIYDASQFENKNFCMEDFPNDPVYIFWIEKGIKYLTKISICDEYTESLDDDNLFWHIFFQNNDIIEKEEIKRFQYKTSKREVYIIMRNHSCHQNLKFLIDSQIIEKRFDFFNLIKEEDSKVNINYNHNINLKSKQLIDILEKTTSEAEKNNIFKKIRSR